MKKFILLAISSFTAFAVFAQSPSSFKYQAVARDVSGQPIANQIVSYRISLIQDVPTSTPIYIERHVDTTNGYGLIDLEIGRGTPLTGNFDTLSWGDFPHFIQIEFDPNGGTNYLDLGVSELLSVPYALHAASADNVNDDDPDPTNELIDSLALNADTLFISEGTNTYQVVLTQYRQSLSFNNDTLRLSADTSFVDLSGYRQDLQVSNDTLRITGNPFATPIPLNTSNQNIVRNSDSLNLTGAAPGTGVDLSDFRQDVVRTQDSLTITQNALSVGVDLSDFRQNLNFALDTLSITNNISATDVYLGSYRQDVIRNADSLTITQNALSVGVDLSDFRQNLNFALDTLSITNNMAATDVYLGSYRQDVVRNVDSLTITQNPASAGVDLSDFRQDLQISNDTLRITGNPSATPIPLITTNQDILRNQDSLFLTGTTPGSGVDMSDLRQDILRNGDSLSITNNSASLGVDLMDFRQDLSLTNDTLRITGNPFATPIPLVGFTQDLAFASDTLEITGNPSPTRVDLSLYRQDLSLSNDTLSITNNPSSTSVDLAPYRSLWQGNANSIYTTGNVGIGTSSPASRLTIRDTITGSGINPAFSVIRVDVGGGVLNRGSLFTIQGTAGTNRGLDIESNGTSSGQNEGLVATAINGNSNVAISSRAGQVGGTPTNSFNFGVYGQADNANSFLSGVYGLSGAQSSFNYGVLGAVQTNLGNWNGGMYAQASGTGSGINTGLEAQADNSTELNTGINIYAGTFNNGITPYSEGLHAYVNQSDTAIGLQADVVSSGSYNVGLISNASGALTNFAGIFNGDVTINGNLAVSGALSKGSGTFKIDHPEDPENKYLVHSFVESPEMLNVYSGNVTTDANGYATVELPDYFEDVNTEFRYQLTPIGSFAQVIIGEEVHGNKFIIRSSEPNLKVSWMVTAVRNDPYARANRIIPVVDKEGDEKGTYLHPELYGKPDSQRLHYNLSKPDKSRDKVRIPNPITDKE